MKKDIHPKYFPDAEIKCACGKIYKVGSTKQNSEVEICSNCHPFFTGQMKYIDTARRIDKFKVRQQKAKASLKKTAKKTASKTKK